MNAAFETALTGLFDQAASSFGHVLKTGVKVQQECIRCCAEFVEKTAPLAGAPVRMLAEMKEVVPVVQKNVEDVFRVVDESCRRSLELMKLSVESRPTDSAADIQARAQKVLEGSFELLKEGTQRLTHANLAGLEMLAETIRKSVDGAMAGIGIGSRAPAAK